MELKQIETELVDVPQVRVTAVYDEEHLALLKQSLTAMGTVNPIIVVATDNRYQVVDGLHRLEEARARGARTVPAVVYQGGPQETLLMNLVLNRVRGKVKASEMVAVIAELWKTHQMDSDQIAEKTGLLRDYIEKLQMISQAAPSVQEALDKEIIGVGVAYELSRLPTHRQQDELVAKQQIWRFTVKELKEFVDEVLRQMKALEAEAGAIKPREAPVPPRYYCEGCKREIQPRYLRAVQICPECYGVVWKLAQGVVDTSVPTPETAPSG